MFDSFQFMQYLNDLDNELPLPVSHNSNKMVIADSPLHSNMDDEDEDFEVDEFEDLRRNKKHYNPNSQQQNQEQRARQVEGVNNNMGKEHYRKSSKENFLQKMNSQEMLSSSNNSSVVIQPNNNYDNQVKPPNNNIIIDLTNQMYEEAKVNHQKIFQNIEQQSKQIEQRQLVQQIQQQLPKDLVTQKDINDFKKQIQIDLQKLTQVLEENTKKQYEQQQLEIRLKLEQEKVQRSIQAEMSEEDEAINKSHNQDLSPKIISNNSFSDMSAQNHGHNKAVGSSQQELDRSLDINDNLSQSFLMKKQQTEEIQKIGKQFAKGYKKGPQAQINPQRGVKSSQQSVKSGNTSIIQSSHKSQYSQLPQNHQRLNSFIQNPTSQPPNQFYLNLQNLQQNTQSAQKQTKQKNPQVLYSTGYRNQVNLRSNSRDRKPTKTANNYHSKSPQSYSSVQSYKPKSAAKSNIQLKHSQGAPQSIAQQNVIQEEENQSIIMLQENEELKFQLHQLRLKNAEHRGEINKLKRDNGELVQSNQNLEEKCKQYERQRKKDCDYILKQESEIEKFLESKHQNTNLIKVQEDQINNLKNMLNQTINVKIKYENIIKRLIENERSRDFVLNTIEQVQQQQQYNQQVAQSPLDQSQPAFSNSFFMQTQMKSIQGSGHPSMNVTQNISQMLAHAASRALHKHSYSNQGLDFIKPQAQPEYEYEPEDGIGDDNQNYNVNNKQNQQMIHIDQAPSQIKNTYKKDGFQEEYGSGAYSKQSATFDQRNNNEQSQPNKLKLMDMFL